LPPILSPEMRSWAALGVYATLELLVFYTVPEDVARYVVVPGTCPW